jgi:hypothetical protein
MKQTGTMKWGLKCLFAVFLLFFSHEGYSFSAQQTDSLSFQLTDTAVSVHKMTWPEYHAYLFIDSCKTDSLVKVLENSIIIKLPEKKVGISPDPFNPFIHETYLHVARGRFWFFGLSIFIMLYFIYFRAVFSKQLELRMKSFLKKYYFEDLMNEQKVSSIAGSVHAYNIGLLVFCQGVLLYITTSEYVTLNSLTTFLVALLFASLLFIIHYFMQFIFTSSLEIAELWKRQMQRQINVNIVFGMIMLPIFVLIYYNGSQLQHVNLSLIVLTTLIIWIFTRIIVQLFGQFQDNYRSFVAILYFCTLEVIPYLLLFKYIKSTL